MKQKFIAFILLLTIIVSPMMVQAGSDIDIYIDNVMLGAKGTLINNSTLVPLRAIFEALGADVAWDGTTKTVTSTKGDITIRLVIGNNKATKNGKVIELAAPAQLINSSTYVPLRFVGEAFGATVNWDGPTRSVYIITAGSEQSKSHNSTNSEPEKLTQPSNNIATKENIRKLVDYGFTSYSDNGAFYNSKVSYMLQNADIKVGTDLEDGVTITLYNWSAKVRELTKKALNIFLPTGADKIYSVVDNFADSGQEELNKLFTIDGHRVYVRYSDDSGKVIIEIYN